MRRRQAIVDGRVDAEINHMVVRPLFVLVSILAAAAGCATGPADTVTGVWRGGFEPGVNELPSGVCYPFRLVLHQTGTAISGTWTEFACPPANTDSVIAQGTDVNGSNVDRSLLFGFGSNAFAGDLSTDGAKMEGTLTELHFGAGGVFMRQ